MTASADEHAAEMRRRKDRRRLPGWPGGAIITGLAIAAALLAGAGAALAVIPDGGTGVFHGCYSKKTGALRVIDPAKGQKCGSGEGSVAWDFLGFAWTGTWSPAIKYGLNDVAIYDGSSYLAVAQNVAKPPPSDPADWSVLAASGAQGTAGTVSGPPGGGLMPSQVVLGVGIPAIVRGSVYGFATPQQMAFDGSHLWIANSSGDSVTEINASDGSWVRTLAGGKYRFSGPCAIAFDGAHLWVVNNLGQSVTELKASNGAWMRTITDSSGSYGFQTPAGIAFDGNHLWVTNIGGAGGGGSVTEISASNGAWIRTVSGGSYNFSGPQGIAFDGTDLWVVNGVGNSVTEISATDGSFIRSISSGSYGFSTPAAIAFDGVHLWITNLGTPGSVTEISDSDGSWIQTLSGGNYGFSKPDQMAFDGSHLWITNTDGNSVTELDASSGAWVRSFSGSAYGLNAPGFITFDGTHLWVASRRSLTAIQGAS